MKPDYAEFDRLIDPQPKDMYEKWTELAKEDSSLLEDIEFLWRYAKACMHWGNSMQKKNPKRKELIYEGFKYALKAYEMDGNNFEALRWTAVLCGATTDYLGIKERIETAKRFKAYLDLAIARQPNEHILLHLRGRFSFEMANLSWVEKKICSTIFSKVPECTNDEALEDFLKADKHTPKPWPENMLYVARCYCKKKDKESATDFLTKVKELKELDDAAREGIEDIQTMIAKLK